jgi:mannose-6-phosphate isomerase-like protein (cupin superfamily)
LDPVEKQIRDKIVKDVRPWGRLKRYADNEVCTVKIITVYPDQMLSLQSHKKRDELWVILDKGLKVEVGDTVLENPLPGDEIVIPRYAKHRLASLGETGRVLEIAFGQSEEEDQERFEDIYNRA